MITIESTFAGKSGKTIIIFRHGLDDYSVYIDGSSVRGTLLDIMEEIKSEL